MISARDGAVNVTGEFDLPDDQAADDKGEAEVDVWQGATLSRLGAVSSRG